jgi:hypothetical protein
LWWSFSWAPRFSNIERKRDNKLLDRTIAVEEILVCLEPWLELIGWNLDW